jgi:hypothetical protein
MMEAVRTSETSVDNHFTWQYIPEDNSEPIKEGRQGKIWISVLLLDEYLLQIIPSVGTLFSKDYSKASTNTR